MVLAAADYRLVLSLQVGESAALVVAYVIFRR
jgi:hypothetical protein